MRFKDSNAVKQMVGRKIWSIYPKYDSGNPKEYVAKKKEYIILGTRSYNDKIVLLYDPEYENIDDRFLYEIREHLNRSNTVHRLYNENYAWAFTEERAEKCFQGLLRSIDAEYEYHEKYRNIKASRFAFSLVKLDGKGISNLEKGGVEAVDKSTWNLAKDSVFSLPENYKEVFTAKALYDLSLLRDIADGKNIFEISGADSINPDLKGKMIFAQDISILVEVEEDLRKKGTFVGKEKSVPARYLSLKVYFKLPSNNYVSIKKFSKFFNIYKLEKAN